MNITEKASSSQPMDDNLKKLVHVAKGLEETLLDYANYKPVKKVLTNSGEGKEKIMEEKDKTVKFRCLIDKIFEFNQIYKRQREQKLAAKKKVDNKIKIKIDESYSDKEESEAEPSVYNPDPRTEEHVIRMLEDGTGPIFKVIRPLNPKRSPSQGDIKEAVNTFYEIVKEAKKSPSKGSHGGESHAHTPTNKNTYDIQGYYKKLNDMMLKQEEVDHHPQTGSPKYGQPKPVTPGHYFNLPMFSKVKIEHEDEDGKYNNGEYGYIKKEAVEPRPLIRGESPRLHRDPFILSPLFSTTNQHGGFFSGFTPRAFNPTPRVLDPHRGIGLDDFLLRPSPTNAQLFGIDFNSKMDRIVDNLKTDIQHNTDVGNENHLQGGLNLDIELINDSFNQAPLTKNSDFKFPSSQPRSVGSSFRRFGELTLSPNSSFLPRKKL